MLRAPSAQGPPQNTEHRTKKTLAAPELTRPWDSSALCWHCQQVLIVAGAALVGAASIKVAHHNPHHHNRPPPPPLSTDSPALWGVQQEGGGLPAEGAAWGGEAAARALLESQGELGQGQGQQRQLQQEGGGSHWLLRDLRNVLHKGGSTMGAVGEGGSKLEEEVGRHHHHSSGAVKQGSRSE